jgi:hypothetical protein
MTDDAVRYVRSGDGQVGYRVVGSGLSVAWVPGTIAGAAATIVTVHEFSSVGRIPWSRWGASATVMRSKRRGAAAPPEGG